MIQSKTSTWSDMSLWSNQKPALGQRSTLMKHVTLMSYKFEPAIWLRNTGQRDNLIWQCQLITWCHNIISKKYTANQGCVSLSTYYLEYGRHLARLHYRPCAYTPTSNSASHGNHGKINSWVSFCFLNGYGAPLAGPSGCRSCAIKFQYNTNGLHSYL